jgi:uncharacterized SAM-binding protein YcdF (DUF218 family)
VWRAAQVLWDYHRVGHEPAGADVIVALGCHDLGVADEAARLFGEGLAPVVVASGGVTEHNRDRFPEGEAVAFRDRMVELGVPHDVVLVEAAALNTGANFTLTRDLLAAQGVKPQSVLAVCMPYRERRTYATCRVYWPEVNIQCASVQLEFDAYLDLMWQRDHKPATEVVEQMVGDLDRVITYPALGFAIAQEVPAAVMAAFDVLVDAGYGARLLR